MTITSLFTYLKRGAVTLAGVCALFLSPAISYGSEPSRFIQLADSADMYMRQELWTKAAECLQTALKENPGNPLNGMLLSNLGIAKTHLGDIDGALRDYDVALAISPDESKIHDNLAFTLIAADRIDEAKEVLDRSLKLDSVAPWPLKMRGLILYGKGCIKEACDDFSRLLVITPDDADVHAAMARCLDASGQTQDAVRHYLRAIEIAPEETLYADCALALMDLDRTEEAARQVAEALARYPGCGNLYLIKAYIDKATFQTRASDAARANARKLGADTALERRLFGN